MAQELEKLVATMAHAMLRINDIFSDPSTLSFADVHECMETFEAAMAPKAVIDAAFAFICERDEAGRYVGSKHATTYLQRCLGLQPGQAYDRLAAGRDMFGEPEIEEPEVEGPAPEEDCDEPFDLFGGAAGDEDDAAASEEEARREEERKKEEARRKDEARRKQEQARKDAAEVGEAKLRIIRLELDKLVDAAKGARNRLYAAAMHEAKERDAKDLRSLLRRWVNEENAKHVDPADPNAGMEKRSARVLDQNADGTFDILIKAVAGDAALFKAITDKGLAPHSNLDEDAPDYRRPEQRRYDEFVRILKHFDTCERPAGGGCASVVVSVTLDQIADADASTLFQTNCGVELNAFDLVRLGVGGAADFVLTLDNATHLPLHLHRSRRTASLAQRIALLALQGVCAWAGCTAPISECEVHHIDAWIQGGGTDINNLAALCRHHHRMNNDFKDHRSNTSHIDRCPETGRPGVRVPGSTGVTLNSSDPAERSAANQLRKHSVRAAKPPSPPPPESIPLPHRPQEPQPAPPPREPAQPPPWARDQDPYPPF
ncbi:HNH endonuclease signature motif containing protein [Corynebacterium sp. Marseille-P4321]|uniref:HNH endonuclease signature motif containing protein n=1 Tax=Corynebacterium sp. Marseille-P4321 TaxID=2736603 RepID=UPI00158A28EE|nr:HNH endonuclease signature motif containing protein [Corynebacterium sp. Marseille-P4321]